MTMMLTAQAAETIKRLIETPGAEGLRIFRPPESLDGRGPDLQIELAPSPRPDEAVVVAEGARLFLDSAAERSMEHKVLHADVEGEQVRFELLEQMEEEPGA